jgi:hypothetical protein
MEDQDREHTDNAVRIGEEEEDLCPLTEANLENELAGLQEDILNMECGHSVE